MRRTEDDAEAQTTGDHAEAGALSDATALPVVPQAKGLRTDCATEQKASDVSGPASPAGRPMRGSDHLAYYARQGRFTDPEEYAHLFDGLPAEIPALCRVVQGLVIHVLWAKA